MNEQAGLTFCWSRLFSARAWTFTHVEQVGVPGCNKTRWIMKDKTHSGFSDRLTAQAEARKAQLAKFKPKPMVQATELKTREQEKAEQREALRLARVEAKEAARQTELARQQALLDSKRSERKERKAAEKADQKARKSARYTTLDALASLQLSRREDAEV